MQNQRTTRFSNQKTILALLALTTPALADPPPFQLIGTQTGPGATFDITTDGRVISILGDSILLESTIGSGIYETVATLPDGSIAPWGASFISVSPDGSRIALGDNYFSTGQVHLINTADLTGGSITPTSYTQENYEAAWLNANQLAVTYSNPQTWLGEVAILDTQNATSTPIITINGASSGIAFDAQGNLYTGNGYDYETGGSETGEIHGYEPAVINEILNGQRDIIDFDTQGAPIADLLSAGSLTFDNDGHLFVGGGDFFGGSGDYEYFALIDDEALTESWSNGQPVNPTDIFSDDPDPNDFSLYTGRYNPITNQWLIASTEYNILYQYQLIPAPTTITILLLGSLPLTRRPRRVRLSTPAGTTGWVPRVGRSPRSHTRVPLFCRVPRVGRSLRPSTMLRIKSHTRAACGLALLITQTITAAPPQNPQLQTTHKKIPLPSPFATKILNYTPAEGQFVNDPQFNDPTRALGSPIGGGTIIPDNTKLVTLGGFGGSITLGFDYPVYDDPTNPQGLDCIIFGNAHWLGGDPEARWAEAGIIEISRDTNQNGLPDDPWYLIPGSDITDPINQRYEGYFILPDIPYADPPIINLETDQTESYWGYTDMTPTLRLGDLNADNTIDDPDIEPENFYTIPDDPFIIGITPGSGGGDAFDIAWAIDPDTLQPANLNAFDFIRITTGTYSYGRWFGEVSTEIGAIAAVTQPIRKAPNR